MLRVPSTSLPFASVLLLLACAACDSEVQGGGSGGSSSTGGDGGAGSTVQTGAGATTSATTGPTTAGTTTSGQSTSTGSSTGGGGPDACTQDPAYQPVVPPARPAGALAGDGSGVLLGVSRWFLGDTDRSGTSSATAWQGYGYDVDRVNTVDGDDAGEEFDGADLVCSCTPVGGEVNAGNLEDGPSGLDNSFGKNVMAFLSAIIEDPSELATEGAEDGSETVAFHLTTLGAAATYDPVVTSFYELRNGETGTWDYATESLIGGDPATPKTAFPTAYVTEGTWVSAPIPLLEIPLSMGGAILRLPIRGAVVTMELDASHTSATSGQISGTVTTEELVVALGEWMIIAAGDTEGLCPGDQLFESIAQNIRSASDVLADGTQSAGVPCGGVTIALGFDATVVAVDGDVAPPRETPPDPCD